MGVPDSPAAQVATQFPPLGVPAQLAGQTAFGTSTDGVPAHGSPVHTPLVACHTPSWHVEVGAPL